MGNLQKSQRGLAGVFILPHSNAAKRKDAEMYARVMTSSPKPGAAETAIAEWPGHIGAFKGKGLIAGYLFFDRSANQFLSITIWESEEAQKRNATSPEQIHGRAEFAKHLTGMPVPSTYEVAAVVK
jgi:heme-degrading monooxygenase HmoA